ncbi:MAG: U32 family peptidase, partial [Atopobiaceae bacterium]|nr:U32 family peptidase [Atopobiaceae bacterium]
DFIDSIGVDAVLVSDLGALALVREHAPHAQIHVSTQASVANSTAALEYARLGASRIVLAREVDIERIRRMHARLGDEVEIEAFVHGSMCMAVSGRCLLSASMVGPERSASCGNCTQPCRWTWKLVEETRPDAPLTLEQDPDFAYILSANDLCMIEHLDELAEAGVVSAKIEGRNKGAYYVAAVTNAYRQVIDGGDPALWMRELHATSHRPFSTGFFYGEPTQNPGRVDYNQDRMVAAVAESSAPYISNDGQALWLSTVVCRNKVPAGTIVTALRPKQDVSSFALTDIEHWNLKTEAWEQVDEIRANMERYRIVSPIELSAGDILCM